MPDARSMRFVVPVAALVVFVLQIVLCPAVRIFGVEPNLVACFVLVVALVRTDAGAALLAGVMGLLYSVFVSGPLGGFALLLMAMAAVCHKVRELFGDDSLPVTLALLAVSLLVVEVGSAVLLTVAGEGPDLLGAIVFRALPATLYDLVVAFALMPLMRRIIPPAAPSAGRPLGSGLMLR